MKEEMSKAPELLPGEFNKQVEKSLRSSEDLAQSK